jgi:hypothetical protein
MRINYPSDANQETQRKVKRGHFIPSIQSRHLTMSENYHPKLDMDNILPVDTDMVVDERVEEKNEGETIEEMNNDATTMKAASAIASESPLVHLPGAYHVAPSLRRAAPVAVAQQGRASSFNRSLINTYTEDHHDDDTAIIIVPTASVVQENELFAVSIVEASPLEDPIRPAQAMDSPNNPSQKDAVCWNGTKRTRIYLCVVVVVIASIVAGLTTALIRSERNQDGAASASLSGFDNSATRSPSPTPSPSSSRDEDLLGPTEDQTLSPSPSPASGEDDRAEEDKAPSPSPSSDGDNHADEYKAEDDNSGT